MQRSDVLTSARFSGMVRRYATWPVFHYQTVGEHVFQLIRIYWQIWGPLPPEVSTWFLWHDAGELAIGDAPYPVKARNARLKHILDELEHLAVHGMGGVVLDLPLDLRLRVAVCDLIDVVEFGLQELMQGNRFAQPIVDDPIRSIKEFGVKMTAADYSDVCNYLRKLGAWAEGWVWE